MDGDPLTRPFQELWWLGIIQGVLALFFAAAALFWPGLTLLTLIYLFSAFILTWGVIEIIRGLMSSSRRDGWWLNLLFGVASLGVGLYLVRHLEVSFEAFILVVGLTLITRGIFDLVGAFIDRARRFNKILSIVVGLAAIAAGITILFQPVSGGIAFVWVLGLYAMLYGSILLASSISLHDDLLLIENNSTAARHASGRAR